LLYYMDWDAIDWERLDRYVAGRGSPAELAALEAWVNAHPELRAVAAAMRSVGRPPDEAARAWDGASAWQRLRRRLHHAPLRLHSPSGSAPSPLGSPPRRWTRVRERPLVALATASAAALLLVAASLYTRARWHGGTIPTRVVATRRGQTAVLELPDGSRVTLAPQSRLRLAADGSARLPGTARDIYLEGEAYLELKHDGARPFRVHTTAGEVEDVGTDFLVTAYPETDGMRVIVASGQVALYQKRAAARTAAPGSPPSRRPLLTLERGELAELAASGVATVTHDVNVQPYLAWTRGNLAFDGTRLGDVVPELERWYDAAIELRDSTLADRRLTAAFRYESLSQVLDLLALSLDLQVERHGRVVRLTPGHRLGRTP
jgi:transmembrane sensor